MDFYAKHFTAAGRPGASADGYAAARRQQKWRGGDGR